VFRSSPDTEALAQEHLNRFNQYRNQRSPNDFILKEIRTERELRPDPNYKPQYVNFPLRMQKIEVELAADDYEQLKRLKERGVGDDDEEVIRAAVMDWYLKSRSQPNPFGLRPGGWAYLKWWPR
jgi:hypothetical protein